MAIQNGLDLIFGKYNPGQIGSLRLDAMLNERQSYKNDVTMFPVENGSRISDHVIQASEEVTITGFVSNTPISVTLFSTVQNAIQGTGLNAAEANNTPSNVLNAYLLLLKMAGYKYPNKVFDKNFLKLNEID